MGCPDDSPLRSQDPHNRLILHDIWSATKKTFIWDHVKSMDVCNHPSHVHLNGFLVETGVDLEPNPDLAPSFAQAKTSLHSDILTVVDDHWSNEDFAAPSWEKRSRTKVNWRGTTTGVTFEDGIQWRHSQRVRLVETFNADFGMVDVLDESMDVHADMEKWNLNERFFDVAFVHKPIQCHEPLCSYIGKHFKFVPSQSLDEAHMYKYELDVSLPDTWLR